MEEENVKEGALAEQIGGTHYKGLKIEPVELWAALDLNAFQGSIVKYVMRYKDKNGKQDLLKAKHYIEYIKQLTPKAFTPDTKEAAEYLERFIKENELSEAIEGIIVDVVYEDYDNALIWINGLISEYNEFPLATAAFNELGDRNNMIEKEDDDNSVTLLKPLVLPKGTSLNQFKEVVETINKEVDDYYYRIPDIEEFRIGYNFEHFDQSSNEWKTILLTKEMIFQVLYFPFSDKSVSFMKYIDDELKANRIRKMYSAFDKLPEWERLG